ncbi:MAG: trimethylamine methyltransferase [Desulforhopalus sp.]|nr:trimethylamine methyltransferase [Desulforhopalus sp.]
MYDRMQTFTDTDLAAIHKASMDILENTGVVFQEERSLNIFKDSGFRIDGTTVFFKEEDILAAIEKAPSRFKLSARNPEKSIYIGEDDWAFLPTYGAPFVCEPDGTQRTGTMTDYDNVCKLVQTSKAIDMCGFKHVEPSDVGTETAYLDMLYSNMMLSDKPFMGSTDTVQAARDTMQMIAILFGGEEKVKGNPVTVGLINSLSPLQFAEEMAGSIVEYASWGQPVVIANMIMGGTSGPVSVPGILALMNAEILAGLTLAQLVRPGTPVIYGSTSCPTNMRTGAATIGAPETYKINSATTQLARHYKLPCRTGGSLTDSLVPDGQAMAEGALCLSTSVRNGANFILHSCGMIGTYIGMSFEKWLIDEEMCGIIRAMYTPLEIGETAIDVETIKSVGPGGNYLMAPSTLAGCRTAFYATAFYNKANHNQWESLGRQKIDQAASEELIKRLASYEKPPIDSEIETALTSFLADRKSS